MIEKFIEPAETWSDDEYTIIGSDARIEGVLKLGRNTRIHGEIIGEIQMRENCELAICESAHIEGNINATNCVIDGYVRGTIQCSRALILRPGARIEGHCIAPKIETEIGAQINARLEIHNN